MEGAQKLSALDASFLHLETPRTHMHIGGVAIFEPSRLGSGRRLYQAMRKAIEPRLDLVPRYRQRLALVPFSLDTPSWVDDADFDIRNHLLHAAVPSPGGDQELRELIQRIFSRQLDRRRPLWELYIVEGLRDQRWALVSKTHHAMVDGISNLELVTVLLDVEPDAQRPASRRSRWTPREAPGPLEMLVDSLVQRISRPARWVGAARSLVEQPARLAAVLRDTASGLSTMTGSLGAPRSPINGRTGPARAYHFSRFPLEDFRLVKNALGGTINDVVLATVAGGLRQFLASRGLDPDDPDARLTALCPVSIRDTSDQAALGNRLAMLFVPLPIDAAQASRRLALVRARVDTLKERKQAVGADFLLNLAGFAPSTLHALVARASLRQLGFNLIVTNVPGPQFPLYCRGARLVEAFPVAFLYDQQQLAVAIFSYSGWLNFGYIADAHAVPDLDVFAACVERGMRELVEAARVVAAAPVRASASPRRPAASRRRTSPRSGLHPRTGGS